MVMELTVVLMQVMIVVLAVYRGLPMARAVTGETRNQKFIWNPCVIWVGHRHPYIWRMILPVLPGWERWGGLILLPRDL